MIRNDYRRALIMLRALEKGYSGHVRLERRTLRGNMQFSITAPSGGELHAAILARKPGTYAAEDLGALGRDGRGQAGLNATFDPRNILGNDLDECPARRCRTRCSARSAHCSHGQFERLVRNRLDAVARCDNAFVRYRAPSVRRRATFRSATHSGRRQRGSKRNGASPIRCARSTRRNAGNLGRGGREWNGIAKNNDIA